MQRATASVLTVLVHAAALLPLALLALDYLEGGLGANPIREIQLRTGVYALILLVVSLSCTPLYTISGISFVLGLRKTLGLYAFAYAGLHFLNLVGLDYAFDFVLLREDLADKPYILAGLPAFLILLVLAVTSTDGWKRRLGRLWKWVHRAVYIAGGLAGVHYFWQVKVDVPGPFIYAGVLVLLLLMRLPAVGRFAASHLPWRR